MLATEALQDAVMRGDLEGARAAAARLLGDGEERSKLTAMKVARRAEGFQLRSDGRVSFTIERHPGSSFLTHRIQTWIVSTSGTFDLREETLQRLSVESVAAMINVDGGPPDVPEAADALEYANDLNAQDGEVRAADADAVALAWVALSVADRSLIGRFRGTVQAMYEALADERERECMGDGNKAELRDDARHIVKRATAIWKSLRARTAK